MDRVVSSFAACVFAIVLVVMLVIISISGAAIQLPIGHATIKNAGTDYGNSGFRFDSTSVVAWNSKQADILASSTKSTDNSLMFFLQYDAPPFQGEQDKEALSGIIEMPQTKLEQLTECPLSVYKYHWVEAKVNAVYCVRTRDGQHFAKIKVVQNDKIIVFDWVYQPNGSRYFESLTDFTPTKTPSPVAPTSPVITPPNDPETIWIIIAGVGVLIFVGIIVLSQLKMKEEKEFKTRSNTQISTDETRPSKESLYEKIKVKGMIDVKSAYEYKGATIILKIKIENKTSDPISDIKVYPYVPDVFLLKEKEKSIALIEPKASQTVTFQIRPTGECGDCTVSGRVNYYDMDSMKRKDIELESKSLSIVCPMLRRKEISDDAWRELVLVLVKAEETTKDIPIEGEGLFGMISEILKDMNLFELEPSITKTQQIFRGTAKFFGEGLKGLQYAAQVEVVGGLRKSKLIIKAWAEKEDALTGFLYGILDEIEKRIKVKEYIDDTIMQYNIQIGDRIGTQVKDSFVQRSNIGAGERRCSKCRKVAGANEKFCNECGEKL